MSSTVPLFHDARSAYPHPSAQRQHTAAAMSTEGISKEKFEEMIKMLDKDGDGQVDKVRAAVACERGGLPA